MTFAQFKTQYHLNLDPQQEAAVQALSGPVLLLAGMLLLSRQKPVKS